MKLQVIGCSHHNVPISFREQLTFSRPETACALEGLSDRFPGVEAVLLSTCNRVEVYTAAEETTAPTKLQIAESLAQFHGLDVGEVVEYLYHHVSREAVEHLFLVASSLDSMVVGEPQILSQVKQAYQLATERGNTGPLTHAMFQAASKTARRVAGETAIHQARVSIPSIAVADFAQRIFEQFDGKGTLVIGAGEMAEETLRYLKDEGATDVTVVNRNVDRARRLAERWHGRVVAWEGLLDALAAADLVISTTGAEEMIVTRDQFARVEAARPERPLFILDLAVPRDFDPVISDRPGVYLYSIEDLDEACQRNRRKRDKELPAAMKIIRHETDRFMIGLHHRVTAPLIRQLRRGWQQPKEDELRRLLNKLPELDQRAEDEIRQSFDRLLNKLMHPPMESLRDESRHGIPHALLDALARLFQLKD